MEQTKLLTQFDALPPVCIQNTSHSMTQAISVQQFRGNTPNQREPLITDFQNMPTPKQPLSYYISHQQQTHQAFNNIYQVLKNNYISQKQPDLTKMRQQDEVEYWRNRALQLERQMQDMSTEISRLRNQPEKVTYIEDNQKCLELERQLQTYAQQIDRYNIVVRDASAETNRLRQQVMTLQSQINQNLSLNQDFERLKTISSENEQLLSTEIQRISSAFQQQQMQLVQLSQQNAELKKIESLYQEQFSRSQKMANELNELNTALRNRLEENDHFQYKINEQENDLNDLKSRESVYIKQIERLNKENADLSERLEKEMLQRSDEVSRLTQVTHTLQAALQETSKFQELELKIKMQTEEIQSLNIRFRNKSDEGDRLKQQISFYEAQLADHQKYIEYEQKYQFSLQENERLQQSLRKKTEENENLRNCIAKLELTLNDNCRFKDYDNKVALLTQEVERLHQSLRKRNEELDQLKSRAQSFSGESEGLQIEISRLNNLIRVKNDELDQKRQNVDQKLMLLSTEVERLTIQLKQKNDEIEQFKNRMSLIQDNSKVRELEQKNQSLVVENDRLNNILKMKLNENEQFRQALQKLEQKSSSGSRELENRVTALVNEQLQSEQKMKEYQNRLIVLTNENERFAKLSQQYQKQIDDLNRSIKNGNENEQQIWNEKMALLNEELNSWKQQFIILNREYHKNQEQQILCQAELQSIKTKKNVNQITGDGGDSSVRNSTSTCLLSHDNQLKGYKNMQYNTLTNRNV